ncbi:sarcosine dehydrogenase, mitochondrial-like [Clavelina lepadiformis]|uniref:sarcosine dehydrogenase, mitochondrial-like n=1 Tax=Clavelina lepadiformis TaxID=159417 RepID=UPI004042DA13
MLKTFHINLSGHFSYQRWSRLANSHYYRSLRPSSSPTACSFYSTSVKDVPYDTSLHKEKGGVIHGTLPAEADAVVIGGGSVGCSTAYHLAKMGAGRVLLLEKDMLTAGTTWHTAGLLWRLVSHDFEMEVTEHTRKLMTEVLKEETGQETGWVQTGGMFTAYTKERMDSYKAMATLGKNFGIESHVLTPAEISDIHPLLDVSKLTGAVYSPLDGTMDPSGTCMTYTKAASKYGAQIVENCPVIDVTTEEDSLGIRRVSSVVTNQGTIKTKNVINCAGVWAPYIGQMIGINVPQVTFRHAYVVTEAIEGVSKVPNVRDHDGSVYLKRQGDTLQVGGYEANPVYCDKVEKDFAFGLYDLDWDVFGRHIEIACDIVPAVAQSGIRSTVCGPESFTPDRSPLLGESPEVRGFFFGSGFNSGGMMLGGGAGREIAHWVLNGKPELNLFAWDVRRFPSHVATNKSWLKAKSHEAYAKHYCIAYHHDQPLAGRNSRHLALHETLLERGCFFEEKHGWERPGYFVPDEKKNLSPLEYDYYGSYDGEKHENYPYRDQLEQDYTFDYPGKVHSRIGKECLTCRTSACMIDTSYMGKLFITGPDASRAARHIFSRDVTGGKKIRPCTYTLMLNDRGGIESDLVVAKVESKKGETEYYMTVGGTTTEYCKGHLSDNLRGLGLNCNVEDRTEAMAILSLQGPKSCAILQNVLGKDDITKLRFSRWMASKIAGFPAIIMRLSFVGELGFEIHCANEYAKPIYEAVMEEGGKHGACDMGYRAMESLSTEVGFHHWGHSVRTDDTPLEARLMHLCDQNATYIGSDAVNKMRNQQPKKILTCFTVDQPVQLFGHETIWRNGKTVGYTRNAVHAYALDKGISFGYVDIGSDVPSLNNEVLLSGNYEIERMGVRYPATAHINSPFDPEFKRMMGKYSADEQNRLRNILEKL